MSVFKKLPKGARIFVKSIFYLVLAVVLLVGIFGIYFLVVTWDFGEEDSEKYLPENAIPKLINMQVENLGTVNETFGLDFRDFKGRSISEEYLKSLVIDLFRATSKEYQLYFSIFEEESLFKISEDNKTLFVSDKLDRFYKIGVYCDKKNKFKGGDGKKYPEVDEDLMTKIKNNSKEEEIICFVFPKPNV